VPNLQGDPASRSDLARWIRDAGGVVDDLDTCSTIVRAILVGAPWSNLMIIGALDELTRKSELWLLTHPCPVDDVDLGLSQVARYFTAFGQLIATCAGDSGAADSGNLGSGVESACFMLADFKVMAAILLSRSSGTSTN